MNRLIVVLLSLCIAVPALAGGPKKTILKSGNKIQDRYIVVFNDRLASDEVDELSDKLSRAHGARRDFVYKHAIKGFAAVMNEARANAMLNNPNVEYIEEDGAVQADATQSSATWGIDRTDQRDLPLSGTYTYNADGTGVKAYIIDTGIKLGHVDYQNASGATRRVTGYDAVTSGGNADDCNGHGSHVAGTVGGKTYGVAKNVTLVAVRVLDCNGSGTNTGVIAGIDWVTSDHLAGQRAVANMSLGGGASQALDDAVNRSITDGVTMAVAAGNDTALNACNYSPARVAAAITVGSTTSTDARSSFSNIGTCVDIFAPGSSITSAWHTSTTATNTISGTSMATPHVCGVAALYVQSATDFSPSATWTAINNASTLNKVTSAGTGSPNKLLYSLFGTPTTAPAISSFSPTSGGAGTAVTIAGSNFTGATSVKFNGQAATFTVNSASQITASAPNCSSTGTIAVTTSGGTATSSGTFTVTGCTSTTTQLFGNAGFESGAVTWSQTAGVIDSSTSRPARTGSWKAWLNGYGSTTTDYIYQQITIPSNATGATLNFYVRIDTAETTTTTAYDKLSVQVLNSAGSVLSTLATYSNLNKNSTYTLKSFNLGTAYNGQTIRIRFNGTEDSSLQTSFVLDDTSLNVTQ